MINKFQTGGQIDQFASEMAQLFSQATRNQIQPEQIAQLEQIDQQSYQQARQMWQQGDAQGAASILMQIIQDSQQGTPEMRKGAKINYLRKITNNCPEGTQLTYYKVGGQICSKCEALQQQKPMDVMASIKAEMFQGGGKAATKKTPAKKQLDQAGRDSVAINSGRDPELASTRPGDYRRNGRGELIWHPDRTKAPYNGQKKDKPIKVVYDDGKTKTTLKGYDKKGGTIESKACPKCGKVHTGKCGSKLMKKKKKCACGSQLKKIDAKKCGGKQVKIDKCGSKMKKTKKHQLGGVLEAIQKLQGGNKITKRMFRRQQQNYPGNHAVISENFIYGYGPNGIIYDFDPSVGRNIYISPHGNDTIYYNYPDDYIYYGQGFMPIGTTRNQEAAKQKFLNEVNRSTPYAKEDNAAYRRAKQEAIKKRQNGGSLNSIPFTKTEQ